MKKRRKYFSKTTEKYHPGFLQRGMLASWFLLEYDLFERIAFGYVTGLVADELGYISLTEMESIEGPLGIGIEQDLNFEQMRLSCVKK